MQHFDSLKSVLAICAFGALGACATDPADHPPTEGETSQAVTGSVEAGDLYGFAMATGDFDGNGTLDLAISAPGEKPGSGKITGSVFVYLNTPNAGLFLAKIIDESEIKGASISDGDELGFALAVVPASGSTPAELVIGAPHGQAPGAPSESGVVYVLPGGSGGPDVNHPTILGQTRDGVGVSEVGDNFGAALAFSGNLLAVGVPGESHDGASGYVNTYTVANGVWTAGPGLDAPVGHDQWGHTVAVADFNGDKHLDIAAASYDVTGTNLFAFNNGIDGTGAVAIYPGAGTTAKPTFTAAPIVIADPADTRGDLFGWSLATGKFDKNANGLTELAIGSPGFNRTGAVSANGRVYVTAFTAGWGRTSWSMTSGGNGDFGYALAAGKLLSASQKADDLVSNLFDSAQMVILEGDLSDHLTVASKNTAEPRDATTGEPVTDPWTMTACIGHFSDGPGVTASVMAGYWNQTLFVEQGNGTVPLLDAGSVTEYTQSQSGTEIYADTSLWDEGNF